MKGTNEKGNKKGRIYIEKKTGRQNPGEKKQKDSNSITKLEWTTVNSRNRFAVETTVFVGSQNTVIIGERFVTS